MAKLMKVDDIPEGHPSQEYRSFHPNDDLLRRSGFKIHSRQRGQQPQWSRSGKVYSQQAALDMCNQ